MAEVTVTTPEETQASNASNPASKSRLISWRGYLLPYFTTFALVGTNLLLYKLASSVWGGLEHWAEYSLVRRFLGLLEPFFLFGFGLAIARQVSLARDGDGGKKPFSFFLVALLGSFGAVFPFLVLANIFPETTAWLCFSDPNLTPLIFPMTLALTGSILNNLCYPFLQGNMLIQRASLFMLLNNCAIPVFAFFVFGDSVASLFWWQGILVISSSLLVISWSYFSTGGLGRDSLFSHMKSLFSYGIRRLPCDLGITILLQSPAFFVLHLAGLEAVAAKSAGGTVGFGVTLLSMAGTSVAPIALIMLPQTTQLLKSKDYSTLKSYLKKVVGLYLCLGVLGIALGELLIQPVIRWYLGESFVSATVPILRIMIVSSFPFLIYCGLRSVIDATTPRPINAKNTWIGLLSGAIAVSVLQPWLGGVEPVLYGLTLALAVLATLTLRDVGRIVKGTIPAELEV